MRASLNHQPPTDEKSDGLSVAVSVRAGGGALVALGALGTLIAKAFGWV